MRSTSGTERTGPARPARERMKDAAGRAAEAPDVYGRSARSRSARAEGRRLAGKPEGTA